MASRFQHDHLDCLLHSILTLVNAFLLSHIFVLDDYIKHVAMPPATAPPPAKPAVTTLATIRSPAAAPSPELTSWETRVHAACTVVAADYSTTPKNIFDSINARVIYDFSETQNVDLVDVVREVIKRRNAIKANVQQIGLELEQDPLVMLTSLDEEWYGIYEVAETSNRDLLEVMREAHSNYQRQQQEQEQEQEQHSIMPAQKTKPKANSDLQLERLARHKPTMDGKQRKEERLELQEKKSRDARLEKLKKARSDTN